MFNGNMVNNNLIRLSAVCLILQGTHSNAHQMILNTQDSLNMIRHAVLAYARDIKKKMMLPSILLKIGATVLGYDKEDQANALITRPFFTISRADACINDIGTENSDLEYIRSVFTELTVSGQPTRKLLITILHQHMMRALGYSPTTSLARFRDVIANTNKAGIPRAFDNHQFMTYCRCVARGLYAVYWFEHYQ
jgi:hypothetical protein